MRPQYLIGQAITNLRRNALVVVSAMLAVFVTLTMVYVAVVLRQVVDDNTGRWQEGIRVIAFLNDDLAPDEIDALRAEIRSWDEVAEVSFCNKACALDEFRGLFEDEPALIEVVEEDPSVLPASLRVRPAEAADYGGIGNRLAVIGGVKEVSSADETIDNMVTLSNVMQAGAVIAAIFLGGAAIVLIANTIRMAIYARRDEISIMKLVGAGNWFVRIPFLLEGAIEGLVGAAAAVVLVVVGYTQIGPSLEVSELIKVDLEPLFLAQWGILMAVFGVAAGLLGSAVGMWGFLRD
jgi:cell division transport system permease protein